jgi:hypothetical protein
MDIRTKHKPAAPMHLKSYQIDGRLLRTGAANFSASGLKRQDKRKCPLQLRSGRYRGLIFRDDRRGWHQPVELIVQASPNNIRGRLNTHGTYAQQRANGAP